MEKGGRGREGGSEEGGKRGEWGGGGRMRDERERERGVGEETQRGRERVHPTE